jgi:hypothetical protein
MSENKKNNEASEIVVPSQPQTVHIFVGGLRRPSKKQNDNPVPTSENSSERSDR